MENKELFCVSTTLLENINDKFTPSNLGKNIWDIYQNNPNTKFIYDYNLYNDKNDVFKKLVPFIIVKNFKNEFLCTKVYDKASDSYTYSLGLAEDITRNHFGNILLDACHNIISKNFDCNKYDLYNPLSFIGFVRDISHNNKSLGLVFVTHMSNDEAKIIDKIIDTKGNLIIVNDNIDTYKKHEADIKQYISSEWLSLEQLLDNYGCLTNWSRYCLNHFVE